MKEIPLGPAATAIVSDTDYPLVGGYKWYLHRTGYAARRERRAETPSDKRRGIIYLHRAVLGVARGADKVVDHIDRNPLNCTRENLRLLPRGLNSFANMQRYEAARRGYPPVDLPSEKGVK